MKGRPTRDRDAEIDKEGVIDKEIERARLKERKAERVKERNTETNRDKGRQIERETNERE